MIGVLAAHSIELAMLKRSLTKKRSSHGVVYGRLRGVSVALVSLGQGSKRAEKTLIHFLETHQVRGVIIAGFAGATHPDLVVGDILIPEEIVDLRESEEAREAVSFQPPIRLNDLRGIVSGRAGVLGTVSSVVIEPWDKERIGEQARVIAVDMETVALAAQAQVSGLPWIVVRAVLDPMDRPLGVVSWTHALILLISVRGWGRLARFGIDLVTAQRRLGESVAVIVEWMQRMLDKRTSSHEE
ncbi:MAG: hypothetical protein HY594_04620 [Candidatus Omnitrophica bacterium]|nr:hypothetical protein [Candidatus Omnitrophota bacterium]